MAYVDYEYYINTFCVGIKPVVPLQAFTFYEKQARIHVDKLTFGRLKRNENLIDDNVRDCVCSVMELCYNSVQAKETVAGGAGQMLSYSNDGEGATFAQDEYAITTVAGLNNAVRNTCKGYLANTELLYRGGDYES